MAIGIGDSVSYSTPEAIRTGVPLSLFGAYCTTTLKKLSPPASPYSFRPVRSTDESGIISFEGARQLVVCQPSKYPALPDFAQKNYPIGMYVKLPNKCPWDDHTGINIRVTLEYGEATSPTNRVSKTEEFFDVWQESTVFEKEYSVTLDSDPFPAYGSDNNGKAVLRLRAPHDDPNDSCDTGATAESEGEFVKVGLPESTPGWSLPDARIQTDPLTCGPGILMDNSTFTWVVTAFPIGPVGLVMDMILFVEFLSFEN